ncbi:FAD synthase [Candidatus Gugararchaeum adminiculabundum]|nr:FAD synthase [Candidatus Gugararchaeum adminiculabundum]
MQDRRELIKTLYLLQLQHNGIEAHEFDHLEDVDVSLLEKHNSKYFLKRDARKMIKVALTGGVFDILHYGHLYTLQKAKALADVLVVVVARDETIALRKNRKAIHSLEHRRRLVDSLKPVDIALAGYPGGSFKEMLDMVQPDFVVFGYDQKPPEGLKGNFKVIQLKESVDGQELKTSEIIRQLEL